MGDFPNETCIYCKEPKPYTCKNTRDMEELYIHDGDANCMTALEELGGGEKGMRYVWLNRIGILETQIKHMKKHARDAVLS